MEVAKSRGFPLLYLSDRETAGNPVHWRPLATTGDHWLATWRPGDLATYWRPALMVCVMALWRYGPLSTVALWRHG
eukprot:3606941-Prymnesium_polylepis.1